MIKIVTFNLLCAWHTSDGTGFDRRASIILQKIRESSPDIIAFQEATEKNIAALRDGLPEYDIVFAQREADMGGEGLATAYRRGEFELLTLDRFWLSPAPDVPGSRFKEQSDCPRICQCSMIRRIKDGQIFRIYNVHLDHESDEACRLGIAEALRRIKKAKRKNKSPLFLLGDFNVEPNGAAIQLCKEGRLTLKDLTEDVGDTFHNFDKGNPRKIDYIFTDGETSKALIGARLWKDKKDGLALSDHYPIEVIMNI